MTAPADAGVDPIGRAGASTYIERGRTKRAMDVALLVLLAPVGLPLMLACALAIRLVDGPPVFFRQDRIGRDQQRFSMPKFRTMIVGADDLLQDDGSVPAGVTRITRTGGILRRTSLDELPQLLAVARGDMSIVGPRPLLPERNDRLAPEDRRDRARALPGLTGLAQIRGRNTLRWSRRIALDLEYVRTASAAGDLRILLSTAGVVLRGSGVVQDRNPEEVDDL